MVEKPKLIVTDTTILAESTALDTKFLNELLGFISTKGLVIFMDEISCISDIVSSVLKIMESPMVDNYFTYNIKALHLCGVILSYLLKHEDIARDFNLLQKILSKLELTLGLANSEKPLYHWQKDEWTEIDKKTYF